MKSFSSLLFLAGTVSLARAIDSHEIPQQIRSGELFENTAAGVQIKDIRAVLDERLESNNLERRVGEASLPEPVHTIHNIKKLTVTHTVTVTRPPGGSDGVPTVPTAVAPSPTPESITALPSATPTSTSKVDAKKPAYSLTTVINSLNGPLETFVFTLAAEGTSASTSTSESAKPKAPEESMPAVPPKAVGTTASALPSIVASPTAALPAAAVSGAYGAGAGTYNARGECDCSCLCAAGSFPPAAVMASMAAAPVAPPSKESTSASANVIEPGAAANAAGASAANQGSAAAKESGKPADSAGPLALPSVASIPTSILVATSAPPTISSSSLPAVSVAASSNESSVSPASSASEPAKSSAASSSAASSSSSVPVSTSNTSTSSEAPAEPTPASPSPPTNAAGAIVLSLANTPSSTTEADPSSTSNGAAIQTLAPGITNVILGNIGGLQGPQGPPQIDVNTLSLTNAIALGSLAKATAK